MNRDQLLDRLKVDGCVENAKDCHFMIKQGLYRSWKTWKTWKAMEFVSFISRPGKSWNCRSLKVMENKVLFDRLFTAVDKARTNM